MTFINSHTFSRTNPGKIIYWEFFDEKQELFLNRCVNSFHFSHLAWFLHFVFHICLDYNYIYFVRQPWLFLVNQWVLLLECSSDYIWVRFLPATLNLSSNCSYSLFYRFRRRLWPAASSSSMADGQILEFKIFLNEQNWK